MTLCWKSHVGVQMLSSYTDLGGGAGVFAFVVCIQLSGFSHSQAYIYPCHLLMYFGYLYCNNISCTPDKDF